jgi:hypothetical protein
MAENVQYLNNRFFIVDPQPPGLDTFAPEDLFMYVKFSVREKPRSVYNPDVGVNNIPSVGAIDFITTRVEYETDGDKKTILNDGRSYATTDWTNIGGLKDQGTGVLEGFGINSINITYGASLVPQVDITFTDVRGGALFDGISQDSKSSLYSVFFKLPYPVFELTVKGYYGKPVTYCLHLVNWSSDFDGSTGNFNIKAKFVGFQQAFLADIVMQNVIATMNTPDGQSELKKLKVKNNNGEPVETPPLDKFISEINTFLTKDVANLKAKNPIYQQLKTINNQIQKLKRIKTYIGSPLKNNENTDQNSNDIDNTTVNTSLINQGRRNIDYISVRDFIVVKKQLYSNINNGSITTNINDLSTSQSKFFDVFVRNFITLRDDYNSEFTNDRIDKNFKKYSEGSLNPTFLDQNGLSEKYVNDFKYNENFKTTDLIYDNYVGVNKFTSDPNIEVGVFTFHELRVEIESKYEKALEEKKKKLEEWQKVVNEKLSANLGFDPKLRTIFHIILNNIQATMTTVYNTALNAESPSIQESRYKLINKIGKTDIPKRVTSNEKKVVYPFPMIYTETEGQPNEVVWLGDVVSETDEVVFPEVKLVNDSIFGYVKTIEGFVDSTKVVTIKSEEDWFPISALDTIDKPFKGYSWRRLTSKSIDKDFINELINRVAVINGFSQYNDIFNRNVGYYDGAFSTFQILDEKYRKIIEENFNYVDYLEYGVNANIIEKDGNTYSLIEDTNTNQSDNKQPSFAGYKISLFKDDTTYLLITDNCDNSQADKILDNNISIDTRINNEFGSKIESNIFPNKEFSNIQGDLAKAERRGLRYFNLSNYQPTENLSYLVWGTSDILTDKKTLSPSYELNFPNGIKTIDGDSNEYIGILTPNANVSNQNQKYLLQSNLYNFSGQSVEGRALMLLNTLPFDLPTKMITELSDVAKVVELPLLYLIWLGGSLWRHREAINNNNEDPIKWYEDDATLIIKSVGIDKFLSNIGKKVYNTNKNEIPEILLNLPNNAKDTLINIFLSWVSNGSFTNLLNNVNSYNEAIINSDVSNKNKYDGILARELSKEGSMISLTPEIWRDNNGEKKKISFTENEFKNYCETFLEGFKTLNKVVTEVQEEKKRVSDEKNRNKVLNDKNLKIAFYKFYKNIYDKWIAGTKDGRIFNTCVVGGDDKDLIDYFNFIDRGWNDLGDIAAINLNSVVTLTNNIETNAYFYISKILRDSNFLLQILPSFVNYRDTNEVNKMFRPQVNLENSNSGPAYVCIKAGGNSNSLEIKDIDYRYKDDSMNFDDPKSYGDIASGREGVKTFDDLNYNVVAFRVAFGKQNQSIFKNVSLNQEEHRETGEYFKVLSDLVDKRGGTQKSFFGNDLYKAYSVRSYKCDIEALGCMNIQPLMYFQLDNVPFFRGAYLIMNVSHSISPNHITTNFSGVRQSSITLPTVTDISTYINLDTDELTDDFEMPEIITPVRVSTEFGVSDPEVTFNFNLLNVGILNKLEFTPDFINALASTPTNSDFEDVMTTFGLTTNEDVTFLLGNLAYESRYGKDREEVWNNFDCGGGNDIQKSYGAEGNKLGNLNEEDGYAFRKRGYLSILGRNQYTQANNDNKVNSLIGDIVINPDLVSQTPKNALVIAAYKYSLVKKKIESEINIKNTPRGSGSLYELYSKELSGKEIIPQGRSNALEKIIKQIDLLDRSNV